MYLDLKAPCSLPLGLARLGPGAAGLAWVSLTLKFPHVELQAQVKPGGLYLTGSRAHIAHRSAERYLAARGQSPQAEIEIEWAIPALMGLGSDTVLGLSTAWALAWAAGEPQPEAAGLMRALGLAADEAPAAWGAAQGGLLLVDADAGGEWPAVRRRAVVTHADQDDDWVIVFVLPRPAEGTPADLEARRRAALLDAAPGLSAESGQLAQARLFPAMERDDFAEFAAAWRDLAGLNQAALSAAGAAPELDADAQTVLAVMREQGAAVSGQSPAGLALFGLVRGAPASHKLRQALRAQIGHFGGTVSAAILSPAGVEAAEQAGALTATAKPIQMANPPG